MKRYMNCLNDNKNHIQKEKKKQEYKHKCPSHSEHHLKRLPKAFLPSRTSFFLSLHPGAREG